MSKLILLIVLVLSAQPIIGQVKGKTFVVCGEKVKYQSLKTNQSTKFSYLIFDNIAIPENRSVSIYLDKKFFSDDNLKALFIYISKKYPSPDDLVIYLHTNNKNIPGPGICERDGYSEGPDITTPDDYPSATFYRRSGNEYFRVLYDKNSSFKTIIIKGKDPIAE